MKIVAYLTAALLITWGVGFGLVELLGWVGLIPEMLLGFVLGNLGYHKATSNRRYYA